MKNIKTAIRSIDVFTYVSLLSAIVLILQYTEEGPMTHSISRDLYFFLNSFFGYKFFQKHVSFFLSDIIILVIFGICVYHNRKKVFSLNSSSKYFLFFVLSLIISLCFSPYKIRFSQCFMIFNFFTAFLFFLSVTNMVNEKNIHKFLHIVFFGLLLISFFEAFTGIYQYFTQKGLGVRKLHETYFSVENKGLAIFFSTEGSRWIFDNLFNVVRNNSILLRAMGTLAHANIYGAFMLFSTLSTVYLYIFSKRKWFSFFLLSFVFFQVFAIFISFSRNAIFGFFLVLIFLFISTFLKYFKNSELEKRRIRKFLAFAGIYFCFSFILLLPQISQRGGMVSYPELAQRSDRGRIIAQKIAFEIIKKHPVTGIGFHNYLPFYDGFAYVLQEKEKFPCIVHNIYLMVASEEGVIGLACFLLFILSVYIALFRRTISCIPLLFLIYFTIFLFSGFADFILIFLPHGKVVLIFLSAVLSSIGCYDKKGKIALNSLYVK